MAGDDFESYLYGLPDEERRKAQTLVDGTLIGACRQLNEACMEVFVRPLLPLLTRILNLLTALLNRRH